MRDYLSIGPTPYEEDCAQVGAQGYHQKAKAECLRFVALLEKIFPDKPEDTYFRVKSNPHDFGSYLDVEFVFEGDSRGHCEYAMHVDRNIPATWDDDTPAPLEGVVF